MSVFVLLSTAGKYRKIYLACDLQYQPGDDLVIVIEALDFAFGLDSDQAKNLFPGM